MLYEAQPSRSAKFSVLQLALPGKAPLNIGILLLDPVADRLYTKLRRDWNAIADPENVHVLELIEQDFEAKIAEMGGDAFLRSLEDGLSHTLRISERESLDVVSTFEKALGRLFEEHVQNTEVIPFVTHVPLYSLRAAATKFGQDIEADQEPVDWVPAPPRLKLHRLMFAARVVGRSMEPLIPDGSVCLFRAGVVGSRQGKRLLIHRIGVTDTSAEFTVKVYTSVKEPAGEDQWRHVKIIMTPLNPEFEAMEFGPEDEHRRFSVIAEFLQVLNSPGQ